MALAVGARLGQYEVLGALGAGGMGEVYRARDTRLQRDVALKILPGELAHDPDRLERFEREARVLASLNHPNIAQIFGLEESSDVRALVMELVEGQSLDRAIPEGGLSVDRILDIAGSIAAALTAAHDKGIVHRDLKPANVMVTTDGRVKVLDFGLAKELREVDPADATFLAAGQTQAGVVMGTPAYMSPEQVAGRAVDHKSDLFSLGVVLYELASGRRPFKGDSSAELASAILRDAPTPLGDVRADLPADLARIIRRCLEKDPRHRLQTARDVSNELRDLERQSSATSSAPAAAPPRASTDVGSGGARMEDGFWVAVLPFKYAGANADLTGLADGLTEEVVTGLSRFSYLRVIARSSTVRYATEAADVREVGAQLGARYVMEGSLRQAGSVLRLAVQLVDASSGAHLWAETYTRPFQPEGIFALQDDLVPRIVSTVADRYGVLPHTLSELVRNKAADELSAYEAVLRSFGYYEHVHAAEEHAGVRAGLERAVQQAPGYADAWAMLAMMYAEEYGLRVNAQPDSLGRALQAARRAADAAPSNHSAYLALAQALFFRKEFPAFRVAAERAIALNPMDGSTVEFVGHLIAFAGDWDRGCELADQARQLNPHHPGWYWATGFYNAYRKGDYRDALGIALKINMPGFFFFQVMLAAVYGQLGERQAAGQAMRELLALEPDFARIRDELGKWYLPDLVDHLMDGLAKAGLDSQAEQGKAVGGPNVSSANRGEQGKAGSGAARIEEGFWVAVLPFKYTGTNADLTALAEGLSEEIVTGLSRFSYLRVIARGAARDVSATTDVRAIGRELGARYVMEGSLRQAGPTLRLAVQVVDAISGAHLWAETYERPFRPEDVFALQDDLVPRIVSTVADMNGVLPHTMSEALRGRAPDDMSPYEAVLRSFGYFTRVTAEELAAARSGLEAAVRKDPACADAWAMLAILFAQEYGQGFDRQADSLASGSAAARRAIEAAPSNHLAYFGLAQSLFFQKEFESLRNAAERAVALNPMDGNSIAFMGELLTYAGDRERGLALADRAKQLNPHHPGWYWYANFFDAYRQGNYRGALNVALKVNLPSHWGAHAALAAAYGQLGEREAAGKSLRELLTLRPDYARTARPQLAKWFDPELTEQLIDGLRKAGLDVQGQRGRTGASRAEQGMTVVGPNLSSAARGEQGKGGEHVAIAVLPFADMSSAKDQEYLCEGMAEEIINALTRMPELRVIARTSAFRFRGEQDLRKVGEALGVPTVLEGSVRTSGNRLRITAQLIDIADDSHIWSERFDRELVDVFAIQDEIAAAIVEKLHLTLGSSQPAAKRSTASVAAYEALLEGRHHFSQFTPKAAERALACLRRALSLDPDYPDALVLHALYHVMSAYMVADPREVLPHARSLAGHALEVDPNHAEAQAVVAVVAVWMDREWSTGELLFGRALALAPSSARVHELYGLISLLGRGRLTEALVELDRAVELDPLSALYAGNRGRVLTCSRRFAEAEESCRRGLALDPGQLLVQIELMYALTFQNRFDEAVAVGRRAIEIHGPTNAPLHALAVSLALAGEHDEARQLLDDAEPGSGRYQSPLTRALVHAACFEMDAAYECARRAIDERDPLLMYVEVHPMFDLLRADSRYPDLVRRMNLPARDVL